MMPPHQAAVSVAPQTPLLGDAERELLSALDDGETSIRPVKIPPPDLLAYDWLWNASTWKPGGKSPASPFPKGSAAEHEAQAWQAFLTAGKGDPQTLPLRLSGSRLLLWEWMRNRDRRAPLLKTTRQHLEDRLMAGGPLIIQGWALRHALCFAIAERDGARFVALKTTKGADLPDTFGTIQALFGMFDGPSPVFRVWQLPGLHYQDSALGSLGASTIWICPPGPPVPKGAAWIIPSATGNQNGREAILNATMKEEAEGLIPQLKGREAWFAVSRTEWESAGLQWFPILIELDKGGNILSVKMGDAAP